jgi:hypothetical protein
MRPGCGADDGSFIGRKGKDAARSDCATSDGKTYRQIAPHELDDPENGEDASNHPSEHKCIGGAFKPDAAPLAC